MIFHENDTVQVATTPPAPNEHLEGRIGYIDGPGYYPLNERQIHYPVALLVTEGIEDVIDIAAAYLVHDVSTETVALFEQYQQTLNEIVHESNERQKHYRMVINHLARKYGIGPDEVRGIYKAVLNYEDYYQENIAK